MLSIESSLNLHCKKFILNIYNTTHKSASDTQQSPAEIGRLMRRASLFSLMVGLILMALKAVAWSYTDSLSIMSSLTDSMLDVFASTMNFVAIRYSLQPPDAEHRFGHGKAEDLATLAQSTFICGSGIFLIFISIKRIFMPEPISNSIIGIGVMCVSIVLSIALVAYQRHVTRKTSSGAIAADALHYFIDFLTNIGVIVALILTSSFGWKAADPIIALCIAVYIIFGAFCIGSKAFQNVMDREFSDEERANIERIILSHTEVQGVHDLRTRKSGIYCFIQFHLDLDENISLKHAHEISDSVEAMLMEAFPNTEILIHQDPKGADDQPKQKYA